MSALDEHAESLEVVPVRHPGRIAAGVAMLVLVVMFLHTLISRIPDPQTGQPIWRFRWNIIGQYLFSPIILRALLLTIELTVVAMVIGIILGVVIAVMRISHSRLLSMPAAAYTWFFRGTPVYVQILFWFAAGTLYPTLTFGVPFLHITFYTFHVNHLTAIEAGIVALSLNEGAYMAEIARAGLISVDEGQMEAALSVGMTRVQTLRHIVLPQAMRVIIPPTGNEAISMLKTTSLLSTIGVYELAGTAANISAQNFENVALLETISIWYLVVTTVMSIGQFYVERRFARGSSRATPETPWQRLRSDIRGVRARWKLIPQGLTR